MFVPNKKGLRKRKIPFNSDDKMVSMKTNDMTKHVLNRIHYFENLQKQIDAHHTKASSITLRKAWLDNQNKINYTNEYDRIRSQISQNVVTGASIESLQNRQNVLRSLGAQSINGIH